MTGWYCSRSPRCSLWYSMAVVEYPTTPPAGPLSMALDPLKESMCARPPSLYMKKTCTRCSSCESKPSLNPVMYR
jgi:hypothetical protein